MPDGNTVLFGKNFKQGDGMQVYSVALDGSNLNCLTCGQPSGNNVPAPRPQGDWILFHSWRDHHLQIGSPGYGGMGSSLCVGRRAGTHVTKPPELAPARGGGGGEDDSPPYGPPAGTKLVGAPLNWTFGEGGGGGRGAVRGAAFVEDGVTPPHLVGERVVR